jgi:hypothetical protein
MNVLLLGTVALPLLDKGVCGIGTTFNSVAQSIYECKIISIGESDCNPQFAELVQMTWKIRRFFLLTLAKLLLL